MVNKHEKLLRKILGGGKTGEIDFEDLCDLLVYLGFERRVKGSHDIFDMPGIHEQPNLQAIGKAAKPFQVRQVRKTIIKYKLAPKDEHDA